MLFLLLLLLHSLLAKILAEPHKKAIFVIVTQQTFVAVIEFKDTVRLWKYTRVTHVV